MRHAPVRPQHDSLEHQEEENHRHTDSDNENGRPSGTANPAFTNVRVAITKLVDLCCAYGTALPKRVLARRIVFVACVD
jgi:hypothetical protein